MFGFVYGILAGAVLLGIAAMLPNRVSDVLLTVLGTVSCLYAVWDIGSDVVFRHIPGSDAHRLAEMTWIPAIVWGVGWIVVSVWVTIKALGMASRRAREKRSDD
jgi:nitrate/nitrite transporter NarK